MPGPESEPESTGQTTGRRRLSHREVALAHLLVAGVLFSLFHLIGTKFQGWALGLGTINLPAYPHVVFLLHYVLLGVPGCLFLTLGISRLLPESFEPRLESRRFVMLASLAAFAVPALVRVVILRGAPLADDESVYRFSADLLASGRLSAPAHELRLFFDHAFVFNDGRTFTQYFLGWPALMAPFEAAGLGGFSNSVLASATVPALYGLVARTLGRRWARLAVVLFIVSPMLAVAAATRLSHTSTLWALTWAAYFMVRATTNPARIAPHALLAMFLSIAFFIRPLTAVGIGLPLGVAWLWTCSKQRSESWRGMAVFGVVAGVFGALFLAVNSLQTGSPLMTAYQWVVDSAYDNYGRFASHIYLHERGNLGAANNLRIGDPGAMLGVAAEGLIRLNFAVFGWFCAYLFLPLAKGSRITRIMWASAATFIVLHLPIENTGIDTFGPVHYSELTLPLIVLTVAGIRRASVLLRRARVGDRVVRATVLALIASSLLCYVPYRWRSLAEMATSIHRPQRAVDAAGLSNAIVFANRPISPPCLNGTPGHFVFWWPMNSPDLDDPVLWANHLDVETDKQLTAATGRKGYVGVLNFKKCRYDLLPLEGLNDAAVVPGNMRLSRERGWERYTPDHVPTGEVPAGFGPPAARGLVHPPSPR